MAAKYVQKMRLFNRDVRLFLITAALCGFAMDGFSGVLLNLYLLRLGYGPEFIGLVSAAAALAFTLCCLPAGMLGTRWGSRRTMIVGLLLLAAGSGCVTLVEFVPVSGQPVWLLATNTLAGIGLALYFVNGIPFLMGATGPEERNYAFSVHLAIVPLAAFAGSLLAGVLPRVFAAVLNLSLDHPATYRFPLLIAALLFVPGVLALLPTQEFRARQAQEPRSKNGRAPYGLIVLVGLIVLLRFAGQGAVNTFFNVYADVGLHTSTALIGALSAVRGLVTVPAALVAPLLMARWGKGRTIVVGSLGGALSLLPLALVPHWGAAGLGAVGLSALGGLAGVPFRVFTQEIVESRWRAAISGALMTGAGLSTAMMAFGGGHLVTAMGFSGLFLIAAGLVVAGTLMFWVTFCAPRSKPAPVGALEQAA